MNLWYNDSVLSDYWNQDVTGLRQWSDSGPRLLPTAVRGSNTILRLFRLVFIRFCVHPPTRVNPLAVDIRHDLVMWWEHEALSGAVADTCHCFPNGTPFQTWTSPLMSKSEMPLLIKTPPHLMHHPWATAPPLKCHLSTSTDVYVPPSVPPLYIATPRFCWRSPWTCFHQNTIFSSAHPDFVPSQRYLLSFCGVLSFQRPQKWARDVKN